VEKGRTVLLAKYVMQVYLTVNMVNKKWYIGKDTHNRSGYLGSGTLLKKAIKVYGKHNFKKFILETCTSPEQLNSAEISWIGYANAVNDNRSYNIAIGGDGGPGDHFKGCIKWFQQLSLNDKKLWQSKQAESRAKGWYVSRIDDPTELYVRNISKWCEEHNVDKSMPTLLNTPANRLFLKQTKGWRIRRSDMPPLEPYVNKRKIGHENIACKGKTWKLIDGKRVWSNKGEL
jgi:hypothetical protein